MKKVLALNEDGVLSICTVSPERRGFGRCNHVAHQKENQSVEDFINSVNDLIKNDGEIEEEEYKEISQKEIDDKAREIDKIAGEKVTEENLFEVLNRLEPEQIRQITKIGFEAAPEFSLPITDEEYFEEDLNNKLYFENLPSLGIAGKKTSIQQMFDSVGEVPGYEGLVDIKGNYKACLLDLY